MIVPSEAQRSWQDEVADFSESPWLMLMKFGEFDQSFCLRVHKVSKNPYIKTWGLIIFDDASETLKWTHIDSDIHSAGNWRSFVASLSPKESQPLSWRESDFPVMMAEFGDVFRKPQKRFRNV